MSKLLFAAILAITLLGCQEQRIEESAILHEEATVADEIFTPSTHENKVTYSAFDVAGPVGVDYNGHMGVKLGNSGMQVTSVSVPEKYGILFRCQHGSFVSEGSDSKHHELYSRLRASIGKKVDVSYKELYLATYDDVNKDKQKELVSRVLNGYDFLGAELK